MPVTLQLTAGYVKQQTLYTGKFNKIVDTVLIQAGSLNKSQVCYKPGVLGHLLLLGAGGLH